jgi:apolipoprotein N-acyltransferase
VTSRREVFEVVALAVIGSALYALAFPPFDLTALAFVAYALPLAGLARVREASSARLLGLLFGTLSHGLALRWLAAIFGEATIALWLIFGLLHALAFWALFALRARIGRGRMLALAPVLLLGLECFRSEWWFLRFPWATLGHALASDARVAQCAEWVGVYGLSLLALGVSALLAYAITEPSRRRIGATLCALGLFLLAHASGALRASAIARALEEEERAPGISVAVVQYETNQVDDAIRLARGIPDDVELAVFPELGAALIAGRPAHADDPAMAEALASLAREARATVAIGATERIEGSPGAFLNTLLVIDESGAVLAHYHKAEPVPLFADGERSGASGPIDLAIDGETASVALCICYDFTHPHVTAQALDGATLAIVASGDLATWTALQHEEHRALARLRAIEHRRYVVRATSSGTSHVIDPLGHERASLGFEEEGLATAMVWRRSDRTISSRLGMLVPYSSLLAAIGILGAAAFVSRRAR